MFQGTHNRSKVKVNLVSAANEHTKPLIVRFYANTVLTGSVFTNINAAITPMQQDTTATAFTGGILLFTVPLGKSDSDVIDLSDDINAGILTSGHHFTATAEANSGTNAEVTISFNWTELF